jgi:hypothetical protein
LGLVAYGLALPFLFPFIRQWIPQAVPVCAFRSLFDLPCPLCGLTRGLGALCRGDWIGALRWNALVVPLAILGPIEAGYRLFVVTTRPDQQRTEQLSRRDLRLHSLGLAAYAAYCCAYVAGLGVL